jgi:hypothetical protein
MAGCLARVKNISGATGGAGKNKGGFFPLPSPLSPLPSCLWPQASRPVPQDTADRIHPEWFCLTIILWKTIIRVKSNMA